MLAPSHSFVQRLAPRLTGFRVDGCGKEICNSQKKQKYSWGKNERVAHDLYANKDRDGIAVIREKCEIFTRIHAFAAKKLHIVIT